jgi:hypothetical protein
MASIAESISDLRRALIPARFAGVYASLTSKHHHGTGSNHR